jgi:hypothetical protein
MSEDEGRRGKCGFRTAYASLCEERADGCDNCGVGESTGDGAVCRAHRCRCPQPDGLRKHAARLLALTVRCADGEDVGLACILCGLPRRDTGGRLVGEPVEWIVSTPGPGSHTWQGLHDACWSRQRRLREHELRGRFLCP